MSPRANPQDYVPLAEQGLSNREIAERLGVSESTVRRGLQRVGYRRSPGHRAAPAPPLQQPPAAAEPAAPAAARATQPSTSAEAVSTGGAAQQPPAAETRPEVTAAQPPPAAETRPEVTAARAGVAAPTPAAKAPRREPDVVASDVVGGASRAPGTRARPSLRLPSTGLLLAVLVPLFLVCLAAVGAIVALGYSNLSHDATATNDRVSALAEASLTSAGGLRSQPQVTLIMGSSDLRSAASGQARRITLVRTDPGSGTISTLAVPTSVNVPLPGKLGDTVTASIAGPPPEFIRTVDRLVGLRVNHLVLADAAGYDDLLAALGGGPGGGTLRQQLGAWSGILHLSDAGSAIRASFASDLTAGEWIDLGRLRVGADQAVRCRLGNRAQTLPGGAIGISGGANRQALDAFLGRAGAGAAAGCSSHVLGASLLGSGIGAAEALLIAAAVLLFLILLVLLRPVAAAALRRLGLGRDRRSAPSRAPGGDRDPRRSLDPRRRSPRLPRPSLPRRSAPATTAPKPPPLAPVARYTTVAAAEDAPAPSSSERRKPAVGDEQAGAGHSEPRAAATTKAAPPVAGSSANGRTEAAEPAPAAHAESRGAATRTPPATATRWVRQCTNCGRRELSRQWETREQARDGGRFALPSRLRRATWQCERCGAGEFELVEYKGPRWMQWE